MSSSERFEELVQEVQGAKWDVILVSLAWCHVIMESGKFVNKHGVAIIVNKRWKNRVNWVECVSERVIAASVSVNGHPIKYIHATQWIPGPPRRKNM